MMKQINSYGAVCRRQGFSAQVFLVIFILLQMLTGPQFPSQSECKRGFAFSLSIVMNWVSSIRYLIAALKCLKLAECT